MNNCGFTDHRIAERSETINSIPEFFRTDYQGTGFTFFSTSHLLALGVIAFLGISIYLFRHQLRQESWDLTGRYTLAFILLLQESLLNTWRLVNGTWSVATSLPLHLCGAGVVLSIFMLIYRKYWIYEICYFWGLGGAIQALFTPDIGQYGFPHFRFFHFFVSHGTLILASLFMTFVYQYRPSHRSVWKIFLYTNVYMAFIAVFNALTGANYLYICHKPATGSILDFLGPWPWYILALEVVGIVAFYIYYSPFALSNLLRSSPGENGYRQYNRGDK